MSPQGALVDTAVTGAVVSEKTIVTTTIGENATVDNQGRTTITAVIWVKLNVTDALFISDGKYTIFTRTNEGTTHINTGNMLGKCTYAFDENTPPTISDNQRELLVRYKLNACRYPNREGFTESMMEAAARLRVRIEDIYRESIS